MPNDLKKTELVAPAGDWASLKSAVSEGADSVYFGVRNMNMRHEAGNFDLLEMGKIMDSLRAKDKKGYLALNVIVFDEEADIAWKILSRAKKAGVHAVIVWDMAAISMAKELGLGIHLSTQASVANFRALKEYAAMGAGRVVLAREVDLAGIIRIGEKIRENNIDCGIEVFVHGAMCVSISGRCFLSHHTFERSANRGKCLQPCRREFNIVDKDGECEYIMGSDYLLSPKDLCTVDFIDALISQGIDAFKIEGRMRPPEYVKIVTGVYRRAIDAFLAGKLTDKMKNGFKEELAGSFNRGFDTGFYFGLPGPMGGLARKGYGKMYIGEVRKYYRNIKVAEISLQTSGLAKGQKVLVYGKKTPAGYLTVEEMEIDHVPVDKADKGSAVAVRIPFEVKAKDKVFLWEEKRLS